MAKIDTFGRSIVGFEPLCGWGIYSIDGVHLHYEKRRETVLGIQQDELRLRS